MNREILKAKIAEAISSTNTSGNEKLEAILAAVDAYSSAGNGTKPNVRPSVSKAKNIIADIYSLIGKHKNADWELNKATDAMYKFISEVEGG